MNQIVYWWKYLLVVLTLSLAGSAFSQTGGKISGKVMDSLSKEPVEFAVVTIFPADSLRAINGASTDADGNFSVGKLPSGKYRVKISFLGYRDKEIKDVTVNESDSAAFLGTILLAPMTEELAGVTITAKKPLVVNKLDKLVYNAEEDVTSQGGAALDILKKVPMVTVDADGKVELLGSSSIRFLINGKPSSMFGSSLTDALQSIPASEIKSIEVITSPGAKYDAQGSGGIINIVLKDSRFQGINGSVNGSISTLKENGALNLNIRKGNFSAGVSFSGSRQFNNTTKSSTFRESYNPMPDTVSRFLQDGGNRMNRGGYRLGLKLGWDITPKDQLTAMIENHNVYNNNSGTTDQKQQELLPDGTLLSDNESNRTSSGHFKLNSPDASLGYRRTFKKEGQELNIQYSGTYGSTKNAASQATNYLNSMYPSSGIISSGSGKDNQTDLSLDYTHPLSKAFIIETGFKYTAITVSNHIHTDTLNNGAYITNDNQTYAFDYGRDVYAGYLSSTFALFKNFLEGKIGLRYERTTAARGITGSAGYNIFAPSFAVQHKIKETGVLKFTYSYRIERPDFGDLNPFYDISDPHNITTGNPMLKPETGENYELGYSRNLKKDGTIYVSAFYRNSPNNIQNFATYYDVLNVNGTDYYAVTLNTRINLGSQRYLGANLYGSIPVTGKFTMRFNVLLGERYGSIPGLTTVKAFSYRANLNLSYQFPHDLVVEVFGNYNSMQQNIRSTKPAFFSYNLAIRKDFLNKNLSVGLTATNAFAYYISQRQKQFGSNFTQETVRLIPIQAFGISVSYKFGKLTFDRSKENASSMPDQEN